MSLILVRVRIRVIGIEDQIMYRYRACFVIFWGAQNIAGESSLKMPYAYGTKAVNTNTVFIPLCL